MKRSVVANLALGLTLASASFTTGCGFFRRLAGNDTVDLSKATIKSMSVDIRKQQKTICPRERVQVAIFADVILEDEKQPKSFETRNGDHGSNNDKLDFADFAFHSPQGTINNDGFLTPKNDLLLTTNKEFEIVTAYRRRPDKFTFKMKYKPDYECIKGGGGDGSPGQMGRPGQAGAPGAQGSSGSESSSGGQGRDGNRGGDGSPGGSGSPGPTIQVQATFVKTPYYDKLIAVRIQGDRKDFLLAPPDRKLLVSARGGAGGPGGSGGNGGAGGAGGSGNPGGAGGNGGTGGNGGNGGNGGQGGSVELVYDARFPELASLLAVDASGGAAGAPGSGGGGGAPGRGGSGRAKQGQTASNGTAGSAGSGGQDGSAGAPGPNGRAVAKAGPVEGAFTGLNGVTPL